jgi:hypothetical protein
MKRYNKVYFSAAIFVPVILVFISCRTVSPSEDQVLMGAYLKGRIINHSFQPLNMVLISAKEQVGDTTFLVQSVYTQSDGSFLFELIGLAPSDLISPGITFRDTVLMEYWKPGYKGISRGYPVLFRSADFRWSEKTQSDISNVEWDTTDFGDIILDSLKTEGI